MIPTVIFDFDDTLGGVVMDGQVQPTFVAYDVAITKAADLTLRNLAIPREIFRERQNEIDHAMCDKFGFGDKGRFADSLAATYYAFKMGDFASLDDYYEANFCEGMNECFRIGMEVFDYPYAALEGALDVLDRVSSSYRTVVVTKGEREEQVKKVVDSGCHAFIDDLYVVPQKGENEWEDIFRALQLEDPRGSWAVGNSLKADVLPPVQRGLTGIHIDGVNNWSYEYADPVEGVHTIHNITEVLNIIPLPTYAIR